MKHVKKGLTLFALFLTVTSCSYRSEESKPGEGADLQSLNISSLEEALGMKGVEKDGEYKIAVPQNDLNVVVDGFRIIPPMGLGSWAAFAPAPEGAMVMGDIVVTDTDLKYVQEEVIRQGLSVTAIHNHFVRDTPHVMFMHIGGMGSEEKLAQGVKAIFEKVKEVRGSDPAAANAGGVMNTLDTQLLDNIVGYKGELSRGVYKYTIGRPDVALKDHHAPVSSFLGFNTWAAWQGTQEQAAVAGDFAMLEDEVALVIKALVESGIEVVAVHNHMVHEEPRIFFLHYWGVGPAERLAQGLRTALDQTEKEKVRASAVISSVFSGISEVICGGGPK